MTVTTAQAAFITDLANKILARRIAPKPTFKKSWNGRMVSSNEAIEAGHRIANEAIAHLSAGNVGVIGGKGVFSAAQIIDSLKMAARRAGC